MWKKSEIRGRWEKYKWWILCIIITLAVFVILYYVHPNTDQDNARYILSAIAQSLAAILALVFTITLVVSQMTRRYTAMDKIIFRRETISLMIIFGIGIIAPLLVLRISFWGWGVILSIVIASFCVFSLIPFLKGINDVLKYDIGIANLNEEIMEAIDLGYEPKAKNKIMQLNEIGRDAVKGFREDVASDIIDFLSKIGEKTAEKGFEDATSFVAKGFNNIGVEGAERGFKDATVVFAAMGLRDLRVSAVKNQWKNVAILSTIFLRDIGVKAAENGLLTATTRSVEGLEYVGTVGEGRDIDYETTRGLLCLGAAVQKYQPKKVDRVIQNLKEMERKTRLGRSIVIEWGKDCINGYPHLESSFEEFKRRYNEG